MISFPAWVERPCDELDEGAARDHALACRRLRFMVMLAAIHATYNASIAALADTCGIERAHIHAAIRDGKFSAAMAAKIEKACGRALIRREWLIYPLETEELAT